MSVSFPWRRSLTLSSLFLPRDGGCGCLIPVSPEMPVTGRVSTMDSYVFSYRRGELFDDFYMAFGTLTSQWLRTVVSVGATSYVRVP